MNRNDVWGALAALGSLYGMKQAGWFGGGHAAAQAAAPQQGMFKLPSIVDTMASKYQVKPTFPQPQMPIPSYNQHNPQDDLLVWKAKEDAIKRQRMKEGFLQAGMGQLGQALGGGGDDQQAPVAQIAPMSAPNIPTPQVAPSLTGSHQAGGSQAYIPYQWGQR